MRNPEFGVGHLEKWAEMLQILKDISANRMPSVADLLKQASQAQVAIAHQAEGKPAPMAGQIACTATGKPQPSPPTRRSRQPAVPKIVDRESSQQPADDEDRARAPAEEQTAPG